MTEHVCECMGTWIAKLPGGRGNGDWTVGVCKGLWARISKILTWLADTKVCLPEWDAIDPLAIAGGRGVPDGAGAEAGGCRARIKRSNVASLSSSDPGSLVGGLVVAVEPEVVTHSC